MDETELATDASAPTIGWLWPGRKIDARDDTGRTDEDSKLEMNLFANDKGAASIWQIDGQSVRTGDTVLLGSGATVTVGSNGKITYDPKGSTSLGDLNTGETAQEVFTYGALGHKGWDIAAVRITVDGVTDEVDPVNSPPVAVNDYVYVPTPYPQPYPYPLPYETDALAVEASAVPAQDGLVGGPIFTTLAIGEEGDPDPLPTSVNIAPLLNDYDPDADTLVIGRINGEEVSGGESVQLKSGAVVTVSDDGTMLTYTGGFLGREPLPVDLAAGAYATTESGGEELILLPEPLPEPIPYPILADVFSYQAFDGGNYSNAAKVVVAQSPIYYDI
jgi:hypothetical protein